MNNTEHEDVTCFDETIEYFHSWYWYRFALANALLSDVYHMAEQYPEAETIGDMPADAAVDCARKIMVAMQQYDILNLNETELLEAQDSEYVEDAK